MEVMDHYLSRYDVPAIYNADIGHEPDNFTIPVGAMAELDADEGLITLLQPAVRNSLQEGANSQNASFLFENPHHSVILAAINR